MRVVPGRPPSPDLLETGLRGLRATVMGLGRFTGGVETARWLVGRGARVTVTDLQEETALRGSLDALDGLGITFRLGGHDDRDFTGTDLVVASPAVPPESPYLARAAAAGVPLATELTLTMALLRGPVVWVTGTCGKSTTTSLLGAILEAGGRSVRVGGNIGRALVGQASEIPEDELSVLEVSSFQLEWMARDGIRPDLAVITNVTPNHLDRHGTFDRYLEAKAAALPAEGPVVLNHDDPACRDRLASRAAGEVWWTSLESEPERGAFAHGGDAVLRDPGGETSLFPFSDLPLLGGFNRMNALQAATAASLLGAGPGAASRAVAGFRGLPHRLQDLGVRDGVRAVNDSKATTPEASERALRALSGPIVLIAGGFERGADLGSLAEAIRARVRALVLIGESADRLAAAVGREHTPIERAASIEDAVRVGAALCRPGDTILLSPGHASWDMFGSYEERGERFALALLRLRRD